MMTRTDLKKILIRKIVEYSTREEIDVAYPNKNYTPKVDSNWLQIFFLNSAPSDTVLAEGYERINGIMQININVPKNTGTNKSDSIVDDLKEIFKTNGILRDSKNLVHLRKVYVSSEDYSDNWYTKFLTIEYNEFNK